MEQEMKFEVDIKITGIRYDEYDDILDRISEFIEALGLSVDIGVGTQMPEE